MDETLNRIKMKNGWTDEETLANFATFVSESFPEVWASAGGKVDGLDDEDRDFFAQSWEVRTARGGGGNAGKGDTWVGMFVGYLGSRDTMERQRNTAMDSAVAALQQTLRYGIKMGERHIRVARAYEKDGMWFAEDAEGKSIYSEKSEERPLWVIPAGSANICLLNDKGGKPKRAFMPKKTWLFVGNHKDKFLSEGPLPPRVLECNFDAADVHINLNSPVSFKAEEEPAWNNPEELILKANNIAPNYDLDWVPEDQISKAMQVFQPDQYLAQFLPVVDLARAFDYHLENATLLPSGRSIGPTFAITGIVDYMDHDGKEQMYAEGGRRHSLTLTSNSLRNEDPDGAMWLDVSAHLKNAHNAFKVNKGDRWLDYAKGSRVWCVVKSRVWGDNDDRLSLDALNVYALPLRSIAVEPVDESSSDLGHLNGFGGN